MTTETAESFSLNIGSNQTEKDLRYYTETAEYFHSSLGTTLDKLRCFPKFVPRPDLSRFLAKSEIFKRILNVHGHIVECGVFLGGGLMTWAQLSSIYEPLNHVRRIIGFDTFEGFVDIHDKDKGQDNGVAVKGGLAVPAYDDLQEGLRLYDMSRPIGHIPRVELVAGDALQTIPNYIRENQHLVVAMLYLDFDLYEPTKAALEYFLPRMPKGAVIAFDELNLKQWPGETLAVLETVGLRNLRIERFTWQPQLSFAVLE